MTPQDIKNILTGVDTLIPYTEYEGFSSRAFWAAITCEERNYDTRSSKVSAVRSPTLRYLADVLSSTIFAVGEIGVIGARELGVLWAAIEQQYVRLGQLFIEYIRNVSLAETCTICIRGMITPIVSFFEIDMSQTLPMPGSKLIDVQALVANRMIRSLDEEV